MKNRFPHWLPWLCNEPSFMATTVVSLSISLSLFFFFFFFFLLFRAASASHGGRIGATSQPQQLQIWAASATLHRSSRQRGNAWIPTPQPTDGGQGSSPQPYGFQSDSSLLKSGSQTISSPFVQSSAKIPLLETVVTEGPAHPSICIVFLFTWYPTSPSSRRLHHVGRFSVLQMHQVDSYPCSCSCLPGSPGFLHMRPAPHALVSV